MHKRNKKGRIETNFPVQHFMHNKRTLEEVIQTAGIQANDLVIEIGAGKGALTFPLAEKAGKVLAVENDASLFEKLRKKADDASNIVLIENDFLRVPLPRKPFCAVSNIPYSITTPIMRKLLARPAVPLQRAAIVMELGAARRFTADPITDPQILKWRMWFDLTIVRTIPPTHFSPPPRVDSALFRIQRKKRPLINVRSHSRFAALAAFGLKDPNAPVSVAFDGIFTPPQRKRLLKNLGVEPGMPVCHLHMKQWAVVFQTMMRYVKPYRQPK